MRWMVAFVRGVDSLNKWLGKATGGLAVVLLIVLLHEVVARSAFNAPTTWGVESMKFTLAAYFMIGGAYTLLRGGHVRMDVLYSQWSPRTKAIADLATLPFVAIYLVLGIWSGGKHAIASIIKQECSISAWGPPIYPLKTVIPVAFGLLLLQVIAFFIRDLFFVFRGKALE